MYSLVTNIVNLDVQDFELLWSSIFMPLFQPFVSGSSEFGWENMISQLPFPSLAVVQTSCGSV